MALKLGVVWHLNQLQPVAGAKALELAPELGSSDGAQVGGAFGYHGLLVLNHHH